VFDYISIELAFGPDGNLYVSGYFFDNVVRFDGVSGASMGVFASDIIGANGLAFGPDGNLYVAAQVGNSILRFNGSNGALIDTFADVNGPIGIAFAVPEPAVLSIVGLTLPSLLRRPKRVTRCD
jgi:DNA-binding beta-propeller fold protein YncE